MLYLLYYCNGQTWEDYEYDVEGVFTDLTAVCETVKRRGFNEYHPNAYYALRPAKMNSTEIGEELCTWTLASDGTIEMTVK